MLTTRDALRHLIDCLSDAECEMALERLRVFTEPYCPSCLQGNIDKLVWHDDGETVTCEACGFTWEQNRELVYAPRQ